MKKRDYKIEYLDFQDDRLERLEYQETVDYGWYYRTQGTHEPHEKWQPVTQWMPKPVFYRFVPPFIEYLEKCRIACKHTKALKNSQVRNLWNEYVKLCRKLDITIELEPFD